MKALFLIPALLLAGPASFAGQILPNLYAKEYCSMRELGVNEDESRAAAVAASYVSSLPDLPKVTINGKQYDADVVQAYRATNERCPHLL